MAEYGYAYRSFSTYNIVRDESRGPVIKPSVPFVPNTNSNSEGYVTKKTIVPVTSRPYGDDYPSRGDEELHRQTNPGHGSPRKVDEFLTKVQNEASHPTRFRPVTSTDWRQSPQPTTYNGANGYGDYGSNKEGRKPVGGTIRKDNHDGYNGTNGYGDNGNYGNKEGRKPIGSTIRNDNYDGTNGYGDYGNYDNKEGRKPIGSTNRNDNYDGYNSPNGYGGYGDYGNKERYKPTSSPIRNDNYDGYNGANSGYGNHNNKEGHRPFRSTTRNDNYDGYNGGNYSKEGHKTYGSPILNDNYDRHRPAENYVSTDANKIIPGGWTRPKISTAWTASPRKGTQLSEPTNDIDKAMELLKEAAKLTSNDHSNQGGHKATGTALPYDNYDDYQRRHDEPTGKNSKGVELVKEAERLRNIVTGPSQSRSSVLIDPATPNKDYGDATRRDNIGDRDERRRHGNASIIDSNEAEKKFKGRRI